MELHDIVVGLDGSENASHALRWAAGLADETAASVRVVSSWHPPAGTWVPVLAAMPSQAFLAAKCGEHCEKAIADAGLSQEVPHQVVEGKPGPILTKAADEADLLVLGRTGSGQTIGFRPPTSRALGSAARHCLHHANGPVAIVPTGRTWHTDPTVVVGIDGSLASINALRWTLACLPQNAKVSVVSAVPPYKEALLALDRDAMDHIAESTRIELDAVVDEACSSFTSDAARRVERHVIVDPAGFGLLAPRFGADIIVVGQRGRGPISSALLGSVADYVVRHASCPVIVVPAADHG